jgi:hypothetical protein
MTDIRINLDKARDMLAPMGVGLFDLFCSLVVRQGFSLDGLKDFECMSDDEFYAKYEDLGEGDKGRLVSALVLCSNLRSRSSFILKDDVALFISLGRYPDSWNWALYYSPERGEPSLKYDALSHEDALRSLEERAAAQLGLVG